MGGSRVDPLGVPTRPPRSVTPPRQVSQSVLSGTRDSELESGVLEGEVLEKRVGSGPSESFMTGLS